MVGVVVGPVAGRVGVLFRDQKGVLRQICPKGLDPYDREGRFPVWRFGFASPPKLERGGFRRCCAS